jgi:hypothetical protein
VNREWTVNGSPAEALASLAEHVAAVPSGALLTFAGISDGIRVSAYGSGENVLNWDVRLSYETDGDITD